MPWISIVLLAIGAMLFAGLAMNTHAEEAPPPVTVKRIARASNEQIERMIDDLEARSAPEVKMGAMCYEMTIPEAVTDYVCPKCGAKTLYPLAEGEWETPLNDLESLREAEQMAQVAAQKLGASIVLDEKQFCRQCEPELAGIPQAILVTRLPNGRMKRTEDFTIRDLWILRDFFEGKDVVIGSQAGEEPLKDELPRLRELMLVLPE